MYLSTWLEEQSDRQLDSGTELSEVLSSSGFFLYGSGLLLCSSLVRFSVGTIVASMGWLAIGLDRVITIRETRTSVYSNSAYREA